MDDAGKTRALRMNMGDVAEAVILPNGTEAAGGKSIDCGRLELPANFGERVLAPGPLEPLDRLGALYYCILIYFR